MEKSKGEKLKIAIIGAGPAGALSAYLLSKQDHQIHLYERNLKTKRKVCGEYLCPQGIDLLKKYDFYHEISGLFQLLYGMKIVTTSGIKLTTLFPNDKYGLSLNRPKFDNFLISKIDPRVQIKRGQSLVNLEKKQDQWLVKTEQDEQLFDLVIAADGIHSKVAKILGHSKKSSLERIALHVFLPLKNIRDYQRIGQMHLFQDSSYCGLDPINENEINFSIVCDSEKLKNMRPYEIINHYIHSSEKLTQMFELISEN